MPDFKSLPSNPLNGGIQYHAQVDFTFWQKENTKNVSRSIARYQGVLNGIGHHGNDPFAPVITYEQFLTIKEKKI